METNLISFILGFISAFLIAIVTHLLNVRQFRSATVYSKQVKIYSDLMPILFSPLSQKISTEELELIFTKAILVSNDKKLAQRLDKLLFEIKNYRIGGIIDNRNKAPEKFSLIYRLKASWRKFWNLPLSLLNTEQINKLSFLKRKFYLYKIWKFNRNANRTSSYEIGATAEITFGEEFVKHEGIRLIKLLQKKMNL